MPARNQKLILIVDDEAFLRELFRLEFEARGYKVLEASNGVDAFRICREEPVDVVISDIRMPGGNGIDLLKKLRQLGPKPDLIFATGFADISKEDAVKLGAKAMFGKPFRVTALLEFVEKLVASSEAI